jgi:hypothetical protein
MRDQGFTQRQGLEIDGRDLVFIEGGISPALRDAKGRLADNMADGSGNADRRKWVG